LLGVPLTQNAAGGMIAYLHHDRIGSTRLGTSSAGNLAGAYSSALEGKLRLRRAFRCGLWARRPLAFATTGPN